LDIEIIKEKENIMLDRKEITFIISHPGPTQSRDEVKKKLVAQFNSKYELIVVDKLKTQYGTQKTVGYAKVYSDIKRAHEIENKYIMKRNIAKSDEKTEEKAKDETEAQLAEKQKD
jgi:small subunit ribosomal protein S24e